jgi:hypothetical protein
MRRRSVPARRLRRRGCRALSGEDDLRSQAWYAVGMNLLRIGIWAIAATTSTACGSTINYQVEGRTIHRPWASCGALDDRCVRAVERLEAPDTNFDAALAELDAALADSASGRDVLARASVYWNIAMTYEAMGEPARLHVALTASRDAAPEGSDERTRAEKALVRVERDHPAIAQAARAQAAEAERVKPRTAELPKQPKHPKVCDRPTKVVTLDELRDDDWGYGCKEGDSILLQNETLELTGRRRTLSISCCAHLENVTVTGGGIDVSGAAKLTNVAVTSNGDLGEVALRVRGEAHVVIEGGSYEPSVYIEGRASLRGVRVIGADDTSGGIRVVKGHAIIENGEVTVTSRSAQPVRVDGEAAVLVRGGTFTHDYEENVHTNFNGHAFRVAGHLTVENSVATSVASAFILFKDARLLLRNVNGTGGIHAQNTSQLTVEGGSFTSEQDAIKLTDDAVGSISDATVRADRSAISTAHQAYLKTVRVKVEGGGTSSSQTSRIDATP